MDETRQALEGKQDTAGKFVTKQYHAGGVYVEYSYNFDNIIAGETWYKNGRQYREGDKPASVWFNERGSVLTEEW